MSNRRLLSGFAIAAVAAVLSLGLFGCAEQPAASQAGLSDVAGAQAAGTPTATPAPPVPSSITQGLQNIYSGVQSFTGEVQVTTYPRGPMAGSNSYTTTLQQWFMQPDNMKLQVLDSTANPNWKGSTLVYDGQTLTFYNAATNKVIQLQNRAQTMLFLNLPQEAIFPHLQMFEATQFLKNVSTNANVSIVGSGTVAGRQTTIVEITPKNSTTNLKDVKVWLDNQTRMPLKLEAYRSDGSMAVTVEYTQFNPNASVSSSDFSFSPPSGAQTIQPTPENIASFAAFSKTTAQDASSRAGFTLYQIQSLPSGVSLQSVQIAAFGLGPGGTPTPGAGYGLGAGAMGTPGAGYGPGAGAGATGAPGPGSHVVVAYMYGSSSSDITTVLVEKSSQYSLGQPPSGGEQVNINGTTGTLYQGTNEIVITWTQGGTDLTLATTQSRSEAMSMAQSVK